MVQLPQHSLRAVLAGKGDQRNIKQVFMMSRLIGVYSSHHKKMQQCLLCPPTVEQQIREETIVICLISNSRAEEALR